ncbi:MAG: twin-arginine translocase TatA/TatE family subunit [Planctomycetes bacterium]|nr:twin-arginine translocase TatA/TatE family subunit [Planctomycetota bacterium]
MMDVGPGELMVILVAALLLFGKRLPEMARNIGRTVAEVKRGLQASALPLRQVEADIGREIAEAGRSLEDAGRERPAPAGPGAAGPGPAEGGGDGGEARRGGGDGEARP